MSVAEQLRAKARYFIILGRLETAKVVDGSADEIERLEQSNAALQERVKELEMDKARLDFLQNTNSVHLRVHVDGLEAFTKPYVTPLISIRSQIDSIMDNSK